MSQEKTVFVSYAREDFDAAKKLYNDLRGAGLNPWLDKESILPGQNWRVKFKKAIKKSRYFLSLNSSRSVQKMGVVQQELKYALEVQDMFPESAVYIIPVRLDDCQLAYEKLENIEYADMFPDWKRGLEKILQTMEVESQREVKIVDKVKNKLESSVVNIESALLSSKYAQFKGEKEFFVGRKVYLNKKIKKGIAINHRVSIVGPGGSGKSQLAFKAIHQYEKDGMFDVVIPIYFDSGLKPLSQFLSNMAEHIGIPVNEFDKYEIEKRKSAIRSILVEKPHSLVFLDNYETVSSELNDQSKQPSQSAVDISNFLNDNIPSNTSILLTSRERNNKLREELIDLKGLSERESMDLFNGLVAPDKLLRNPNEQVKQLIQNLLKKTRGHPLSIELIVKNITSVEELEEISEGLGRVLVDRTASEERFKTLEACFGYTLNKLDNALRELLPKLAIFKSPFPISAAVEIFAVQKSDIINLYNRSLLTRIESENLDYLLYYIHPALRDYLQNISDKNLEFKYGEAFSRYYSIFLFDTYSEWGKAHHLASIARFNIIAESEYSDFDRAIELTNNLHVGADISLFLGLIFSNLGLLSKALGYHRRSIGVHEKLNDRVGLASDYKNIGNVLRGMGRYQEALDSHNNALKIHEKLNDKAGMANDYSNIGVVLGNMGKYQEALESHNKAHKIHEELDDRVGMSKDYSNIGVILNDMGKYQDALESHNNALKIDEGLNDRVGMADDYTNMGLVLDNLGNHQKALESHNNALKIHEELNDRVGMARDYTNMGLVLYNMSKYQEALVSINNALKIHEELNDRVGLAADYKNIGLVLGGMGEYQDALDNHNNALKIDEELNDRVELAKDYSNIGGVRFNTGNYQEALESYNKALEVHEELNDRVQLAKDYWGIGNVLVSMGYYQEALDSHNKALKIHEELNDKAGMARDYSNIGVVLRRMGKLQEALDSHSEALNIDEELNDKVGMGRGYVNVGVVLGNMGKLQEALESYNKGLKIHEELNDRVVLAKDYSNIGVVLGNMGKLQEALDSHSEALKIHEQLNDRAGMANDYYNISSVLSKTSTYEALKSLYRALTILNEFEEYHPLMDDVNKMISYLEG
jgi:tetratricopeptide (TPR) repeat protein